MGQIGTLDLQLALPWEKTNFRASIAQGVLVQYWHTNKKSTMANEKYENHGKLALEP